MNSNYLHIQLQYSNKQNIQEKKKINQIPRNNKESHQRISLKPKTNMHAPV